jgi:hypothetical protein
MDVTRLPQFGLACNNGRDKGLRPRRLSVRLTPYLLVIARLTPDLLVIARQPYRGEPDVITLTLCLGFIMLFSKCIMFWYI